MAVPRLDHLPDRRRHRDGRHVEGLRGDGAHRLEGAGTRPKMVSVQAENCAPIVRAFEQGAERSEMWQNARTVADGLRVPKAIGDFLVLRAVRESGGTAIAVSDADMVARCARSAPRKASAPRPKGAPRSTRSRLLQEAASSPPTPWWSSIPAGP